MNKSYLTSLVVALVLIHVTPAAADGWLEINTSVSQAYVMVDEYDGIRMNGKQISLKMEAGRHLIMIDKEGYQPHLDTITIQDGSTQEINVWMQPLSESKKKPTSNFDRLAWNYQLINGFNAIRWAGIGFGVGTGLDLHVSLFDMRFGMFILEPCTWGMNIPFYNYVSHVQTTTWLVHCDRTRDDFQYEVAIPVQDFQFYYTPMVGFQLPVANNVALSLAAGPQISWTRISWRKQWRNDLSVDHEITYEEFPRNGFQFDPVWFSIQAGALFSGFRADMLVYLKYQDGCALGLEFRF